jgi:hypothetical protein
LSGLGALAALALAAAQPSIAPPPPLVTLDDIDRAFVCPENLPAELREGSLGTFMNEVAAATPDVAVLGFAKFRLALLNKHHCRQTLAAIDRARRANPNKPPTASEGWALMSQGSVDGHIVSASVDVDRTTIAGAGRLRTWIRYRREDQPAGQTLVYEQLNCRRGYHATIMTFGDDAAGRAITHARRSPAAETAVAADSPLAGILPRLCRLYGQSAR